MSDDVEDLSLDEFEEEIEEQAEAAEVKGSRKCSEDRRVKCATLYGPRAVERKILVSISENINTMADAIKESEAQKHKERAKCVNFFIGIMMFLVGIVTLLIVADTFWGFSVRLEFLVSVILAILADVFAIVHTLVKYMTNVENYNAYGNLIDSLLKHVDNNSKEE